MLLNRGGSLQRFRGPGREELLPPRQVQNRYQYRERNQRQQIGGRTGAHRVRLAELRDSRIESRHRGNASEESDENSRNRASGDVARRHQNPRTLVALGDKLNWRKPRSGMLERDPLVYQEAHEPTDENRRR